MIPALPTKMNATALAGLGFALALVGCSDKEIRVYRAPKDSAVVLAAPADSPAVQAQTPSSGEIPQSQSGGPTLTWDPPSDWRAKGGDAIRRASFSIGNDRSAAEVAITVFPGDAGGVLANVNRWRGQVGLPPVDQRDLNSAVSTLDAADIHFVVVEASGTSKSLVAAMAPWGGATWFFKLSGDRKAVAQASPAFLGFLKTVRP